MGAAEHKAGRVGKTVQDKCLCQRSHLIPQRADMECPRRRQAIVQVLHQVKVHTPARPNNRQLRLLIMQPCGHSAMRPCGHAHMHTFHPHQQPHNQPQPATPAPRYTSTWRSSEAAYQKSVSVRTAITRQPRNSRPQQVCRHHQLQPHQQ